MSRYPNAAAQGGWVGVSKHPAELGVLMQTARRFADWNIAHGAIRCGGQGDPERHFPFSIFNFQFSMRKVVRFWTSFSCGRCRRT